MLTYPIFTVIGVIVASTSAFLCSAAFYRWRAKDARRRMEELVQLRTDMWRRGVDPDDETAASLDRFFRLVNDLDQLDAETDTNCGVIRSALVHKLAKGLKREHDKHAVAA
ncbi:MAG TPA: hypothetical protein VLE72_02395 [Candidatus Saccharimonadales bacterium]|nr:hypothetical protein [Candidatus Saccharimonadales bacterium]